MDDQPDVPESQYLDDEAVEQVFESLELKRRQWAVHYSSKYENFKSNVLGGEWTASHKKVIIDAVLAYASGQKVKDWCVKYSLPRSASFALAKYGEYMASHLALYWAARMQQWFDIWESQDDDDYTFSESDIETFHEPLEELSRFAGLQPGHVVMERLAELRDIVPMEPIV